MRANKCIEPTTHQRCWWVPSALRASAAAHAQRYALQVLGVLPFLVTVLDVWLQSSHIWILPSDFTFI